MEFWPPSNSFSHSSHLYDTYDMSSSSSISASPTISELDLYPPPLYNSAFSPIPDDLSFNYPIPLTPSDFGSPEDGPLYSPRSTLAHPLPHPPAEKTHATSGVSGLPSQKQQSMLRIYVKRRRAQNRAAQRAFRERKEKHARDLEQKLAELTVKYQSLETSHSELTAAYEKLQKTLEILTQKEEVEGGGRSAETLRKFLTILHGELRLKAESEDKL
ncbi:uncharacterized protein PV09_03232 [Verruconis gallopava]|uniref:Putative transcription factor kapC n=1 Tax=Verruconis gallopava TaxID=253628 RepID=A0A0D2AGM7_9PEZI|nr:uncharacterized protein PV09_03232 [Verruconis gallopava]KIW06058.1 hypothetical protein PV09_03232 [Verruconis gallopava]